MESNVFGDDRNFRGLQADFLLMHNSVSYEDCVTQVQAINSWCELMIHRLLHERNQRKLLEWKRLCNHMIDAVKNRKMSFQVQDDSVDAAGHLNSFDRFIKQQKGIVAVINDVYNT
jgi:hypothetical protein